MSTKTKLVEIKDQIEILSEERRELIDKISIKRNRYRQQKLRSAIESLSGKYCVITDNDGDVVVISNFTASRYASAPFDIISICYTSIRIDELLDEEGAVYLAATPNSTSYDLDIEELISNIVSREEYDTALAKLISEFIKLTDEEV